jgi:hypothetical protein
MTTPIFPLEKHINNLLIILLSENWRFRFQGLCGVYFYSSRYSVHWECNDQFERLYSEFVGELDEVIFLHKKN